MKKEEDPTKEGCDGAAFAHFLFGPGGRQAGAIFLMFGISGNYRDGTQGSVNPMDQLEPLIASIQVDEPLRLSRDYAALFAGLLDRTHLWRLLKTHQDWCRQLLAEPSFYTVIESYPIDLLFPIRQGRSPQLAGKKSKDKGRWSVGIKLCWLLNDQRKVVAWDWATMNMPYQDFHPVIEQENGQCIVLADYGFRSVEGISDNCKLCAKGAWNERMCVETAQSMVTFVCDLKHLYHRLPAYIQARLASDFAMFSTVLALFHRLHPDADPFQMSISEFFL